MFIVHPLLLKILIAKILMLQPIREKGKIQSYLNTDYSFSYNDTSNDG
jgi:hypothetical protein